MLTNKQSLTLWRKNTPHLWGVVSIRYTFVVNTKGTEMVEIITSGITKGGTGKSTLATNLAVHLNKTGSRAVRVLDLDHRNKSSHTFFSNRDDIECILIKDMQHLMDSCDFDGIIVADIGGFDTELTRGIITASDIVLIPFSPKSDKDIAGLVYFLEMMDEINEIPNVDITSYLVPSMIHHLSDQKKILKELNPIVSRGYEIAGTITRRMSYEVSGDESKNVVEYGDSKASIEIMTITDKVLDTLKSKRI